MDSTQYTNHRGQGVPSHSSAVPAASPEVTVVPDHAGFCAHITNSGRRCRLPLTAQHPSLCDKHAKPPAGSQNENDVLADELLESVQDFSSASSVNIFLGNIAVQLARKRIKRADAIALAYISQLMLNSQTAMERERQGDLNWYGLPIKNYYKPDDEKFRKDPDAKEDSPDNDSDS